MSENNYWTKETDEAIINYKNTRDNSLLPVILSAFQRLAAYHVRNSENFYADRDTVVSDLFTCIDKLNFREGVSLFFVFNRCALNSKLIIAESDKTYKKYIDLVDSVPETSEADSPEYTSFTIIKKDKFIHKHTDEDIEKLKNAITQLVDEEFDVEVPASGSGKLIGSKKCRAKRVGWQIVAEKLREKTGFGQRKIQYLMKYISYKMKN